MNQEAKVPPSATLIRFPKSAQKRPVEGRDRSVANDLILQAVHFYIGAQRLLGRRVISPELVALGLQLPMDAVLQALKQRQERKGN
jgi:hypothetical protein